MSSWKARKDESPEIPGSPHKEILKTTMLSPGDQLMLGHFLISTHEVWPMDIGNTILTHKYY